MFIHALLVDDSRSVLDLLKRLVEAEGSVQVTTFLGSSRSAGAARATSFDIVLTDYEMPNLDGIALIRQLRVCFRNFPTLTYR